MIKRIKRDRFTASRRRRPLIPFTWRQASAVTSEPSRRGGVTLTEVLMAILCMGIGVVAVASLFPIALLRSVQATQLTSSTILRFNAETLVDIYDEFPYTNVADARNLVFNPDYSPPTSSVPNLNFAEHFLGAPSGDSNYLIDPLGAMIVRDEKGLPRNQQLATAPAQIDRVGAIRRYDALRVLIDPNYAYPDAITDQRQAENIVTLPDSWITLYDDFPADNNATSVTMPANTKVDFADVRTAAQAGDVRIVLFNKNGRLSEVRNLVAANVGPMANPDQLGWTRALPNNNQYFPQGMLPDPGAITRVRIEAKERRYTWLLSVRNYTTDAEAPSASVDVVVFFRRSLSAEEETPYLLTRVAGQPRKYQVSGRPKFLKKGGFLLDTNFGKWHRIQEVTAGATPIVTLERNTNGSLDMHQAVFMRGVIDVYPLSRKPSR